jgi:hypothetical protein
MHYLHNAQDHEDDVAKAHYCKGKARKVAACLKAVTIAYFSVATEFPNDLSEELLRANAPKVLEKFENLTSKGKWKTNVSAKEEETEEDRDEEVGDSPEVEAEYLEEFLDGGLESTDVQEDGGEEDGEEAHWLGYDTMNGNDLEELSELAWEARVKEEEAEEDRDEEVGDSPEVEAEYFEEFLDGGLESTDVQEDSGEEDGEEAPWLGYDTMNGNDLEELSDLAWEDRQEASGRWREAAAASSQHAQGEQPLQEIEIHCRKCDVYWTKKEGHTCRDGEIREVPFPEKEKEESLADEGGERGGRAKAFPEKQIPRDSGNTLTREDVRKMEYYIAQGPPESQDMCITCGHTFPNGAHDFMKCVDDQFGESEIAANDFEA